MTPTEQRAYDIARRDAERAREAAEWRAESRARTEEVLERINRPVPELRTDVPVGLCSRKRAEYLMMAAAHAGGAIYVGMPPIEGLTEDGGYLCVGTVGGEPVGPRALDPRDVIGLLRRALRQWSAPHVVLSIDEYVTETLWVLDDLERKLAL